MENLLRPRDPLCSKEIPRQWTHEHVLSLTTPPGSRWPDGTIKKAWRGPGMVSAWRRCSAGTGHHRPMGGASIWDARGVGRQVPAYYHPVAHLGNSLCSGFLLPAPSGSVDLEILFLRGCVHQGSQHPGRVIGPGCQKEVGCFPQCRQAGPLCVPRASTWAPLGAPLRHSDGR